jgi:hypothetical protein
MDAHNLKSQKAMLSPYKSPTTAATLDASFLDRPTGTNIDSPDAEMRATTQRMQSSYIHGNLQRAPAYGQQHFRLSETQLQYQQILVSSQADPSAPVHYPHVRQIGIGTLRYQLQYQHRHTTSHGLRNEWTCVRAWYTYSQTAKPTSTVRVFIRASLPVRRPVSARVASKNTRRHDLEFIKWIMV